MNKLFEKINVVTILRATGLILLALVLLQACINAPRGAEWDDVLKIFFLTIFNGLFQPLILIGIAEGLNRMGAKRSE